jgi:hypothetical protein
VPRAIMEKVMSTHSVKHWLLPAACAWMLLAGNALCPAATVVINELMASNVTKFADPQNEYDDWIEFYNAGTTAVDMAGMYFTDNLDQPTKWRFPTGHPELTTIAAGGYLLLWADSQTEAAGLHASFNLSASGEEVGLFDSTGRTLIDRITFGEQTADVSYGRKTDGGSEWVAMVYPTPGTPNMAFNSGVVEAPQFSVARGFYDSPFTLVLTTPTEGAEVYYRLDYIDPRTPLGFGPGATKYTGPIPINHTTCVRAVATKTGWLSSPCVTATYISLNDVVKQPTLPAGFPATWGSTVVDYEVDPDVVNDPTYSGEFKDDLKKNPSVSIVIANDDFFGASKGIYANTQMHGLAWEKPASIEWIDPVKGEDFQVNAGLRVHGSQYGRTAGVPKHSLRILFKNEYGPTELKFPLFPDSKVDHFDQLVLRGIWNYSWIGDSGMSGWANADYLRDIFARDTIRDMGGLTPHGRHVNLYINGLFWGMYVLSERPDDGFAALHLGGDKEDYDILYANSSMEVVAGDLTAWNAMLAAAAGDLKSPQAYEAFQKLVDVPAMIDYLLMIYFVGSRDAPVLLNNDTVPRNFYALRRRNPPGPWLFLPWDVEWSLEYGNENRVRIVGQQNPHYLLNRLMDNSDFRMLLADRIYKSFFHDGALTPATAIQRYGFRVNDIWGAIVGESARWGDARRPSRPYTRDLEWAAEVNRLMTQYFPARTDTVLGQLRQAGQYPSVSPPEFYVNGQPMHGGHIDSSDLVSMEADSGTIWYTLDGNDPRLPGSPAGSVDEALWIPESAPKKVLVPTGPITDAWRGGSAFDDSAWISGSGGVGYERSNGFEDYFSINVRNQMYKLNETCYIRIPFAVTQGQLTDISNLMLKIRYDDGFIIYLNGTEIQRALFEGTPVWNSGALENHNEDDATNLEPFDISAYLDKIEVGQNILAVQALNCGTTSSDFLFSVEMVASKGAISGVPAGVSSTAIRYQGPFTLEGSTRIRARALSGGTWSAVNEAVFAVGPVAQSLRISEIMYHPADTGNPNDPNTEFIELTNIAAQPITNGVTFTFPWYTLAPDDYCLVIKDSAAFQAKYGTGLPVVGQWQGNLNNAGERIELQDAIGTVIHDFKYKDSWYDTTDGSGFSLVIRDPAAVDPNNLADPAVWRASTHPGGSPGAIDP